MAAETGSPYYWPKRDEPRPDGEPSVPTGRQAPCPARGGAWPCWGALGKEESRVDSARPSPLAGRSFRFTWTAGPRVPLTHEHVFHGDGTVSYAAAQAERPREFATSMQCGVFEVAQDIYLVSYLDACGYTLSVAMNFQDRRLHGFASDTTRWYPLRGRFEEFSR